MGNLSAGPCSINFRETRTLSLLSKAGDLPFWVGFGTDSLSYEDPFLGFQLLSMTSELVPSPPPPSGVLGVAPPFFQGSFFLENRPKPWRKV